MRALVFDGRHDRRVTIPAWVTFSLASAGGEVILAACSRCEGSERVEMPLKRDAERALGRFALWHDRCKDRSSFAYLVDRACENHGPMPPTIYFKKGA